MPSSRRPILLVLLAVVALSAAACDLTRVPGTRTWTAAAESVNGRTFVVNVRDTSGRIADVEIDPAGVCDAMGVAHILRITGLAAIPAATVTVGSNAGA